jgi:predicted DNA-binding transcriptional regulator YafY
MASSFENPLILLRDLLKGTALDRRTAAERVGVKVAAADTYLRALREYIPGVQIRRRESKTFYTFNPAKVMPAPTTAEAMSACLALGFARLFEGSHYETSLRTSLLRLATRARRFSDGTDIDRKFIFVTQGGEMGLPERVEDLDDLVGAVLESKRTRLKYRRFNGDTEEVLIDPLSIAIHEHQLYVFARTDGHPVHPYRFSRMAAVDVTPKTFKYPLKAEYDPKQVLKDSIGIFVGDDFRVETVCVRLSSKWAAYAQTHRWHVTQRMNILADGAVLLTLTVRTCPELERWILAFGEDAEVLGPDGLREKIAHRTMKAAGLYASPRMV